MGVLTLIMALDVILNRVARSLTLLILAAASVIWSNCSNSPSDLYIVNQHV